MLKVAVGSLNKIKIEATKEAFKEYFEEVDIKPIYVKYIDQPLSIEETVKGAIYRAEYALKNIEADYGVGIEAGLVNVLGYNLNIQIAAVKRDNKIYLGFGPAFQLPKVVEELVLKGLELEKAIEKIFNIKDIGEKGGIIEIMSKGKIDRKMLITYAVKMALVRVISENNLDLLYG